MTAYATIQRNLGDTTSWQSQRTLTMLYSVFNLYFN